jgi:hypothetical protein
MQNLQKVMEAIARTKQRPHNTHMAFAELLEIIGEHADQALLEYDEAVQHEQEYIILESENLDLKRQIRMINRVAS